MSTILDIALQAILTFLVILLCLIASPFILLWFIVYWAFGETIVFTVNDKRVADLRWFTFRRF